MHGLNTIEEELKIQDLEQEAAYIILELNLHSI